MLFRRRADARSARPRGPGRASSPTRRSSSSRSRTRSTRPRSCRPGHGLGHGVAGQGDRGDGRAVRAAPGARLPGRPAPLRADGPRPGHLPTSSPGSRAPASTGRSSSAATPRSRASSPTASRCSGRWPRSGIRCRDRDPVLPAGPRVHRRRAAPRRARATRPRSRSYMTTQLCFDPGAIATWIAARRAEGIALPVHVGVPGVAEPHKLLAISARIGVADTHRFLTKNIRFVARLMRSGGFYRPDGAARGPRAAHRRSRGPDRRPPHVHVQCGRHVRDVAAGRCLERLRGLTAIRRATACSVVGTAAAPCRDN